MAKDLGYAGNALAEVGITSSIARAAHKRFIAADEAGHSQDDIASIVEPLRGAGLTSIYGDTAALAGCSVLVSYRMSPAERSASSITLRTSPAEEGNTGLAVLSGMRKRRGSSMAGSATTSIRAGSLLSTVPGCGPV